MSYRSTLSAIPIVVGLLVACPALASTHLSVDFASDEINTPPAGAVIEETTGKQQALVRGRDGKLDFGGVDGRFLQLRKDDKEDNIPRATWSFDPVEEGTLSFTFSLPETDEYPNALLTVFMMLDSLQNVGPGVTFTRDQVLIEVDGGERREAFPHAFDPLRSYRVAIRFYADATFTLEVDGVPFPDDRRFSYANEAIGFISVVQFSIAWLTAERIHSFVDDIRVESSQ